MMRRKKNESVMRLANQNSSNSKRLFPVIRTWGTLNRFSFCTGVTEPTQTRKFPALWGLRYLWQRRPCGFSISCCSLGGTSVDCKLANRLSSPMPAPAVWVVVGASRGIGLEWVRQLLARGDHVLATVRDVAKASQLWTLAGCAAVGRCQLFECDVASEASINVLYELCLMAWSFILTQSRISPER